MPARDYLAALVRTAAAALAGYVLAFLFQHGWDLPDAVDSQISLALATGLAGAYNLAVNWLTVHVHPAFGYLLIVPKTPVYGDRKSLARPEVPALGHPPARRFYGHTAPSQETSGEFPRENPGGTEAGLIDVGTIIAAAIVLVIVGIVLYALLVSR